MSPLFPIFQTDTPKIGRNRIFADLRNELTKPSPAHISLVGPRYSGKTVLLQALRKTLQDEDGPYESVIYWDLGHRTPQTNVDFLRLLRSQIAQAIKHNHPDEASYLEEADADYDELHEVIDQLGQAELRLLLLWDGFDRPLLEGTLTRNLWDNLLELCRMPAFRVVTASRRGLRELIRNAESVTSDFWGVFETMKLRAMDLDDLDAFAANLQNRQFEAGALKEALNWTGGIPPLVAWLMNRVNALPAAAALDSRKISELAKERDDRCTGILEQIWSDCSAPAQDLYRALVQDGRRKPGDISKTERQALAETGLARENTGSVEAACRILHDHLGSERAEFGALARLFGSWVAYATNIKGILERRISHIGRFDDSLFHMVERAIEDIPAHVDVCLGNLSQIEERALDFVWKRETDEKGNLLPKVISEWTLKGNYQEHKLVKEMREADENGDPRAWEVPADRTKQLGLLQLLTGSHHVYKKSLACVASKDTYVLLNAIHSFRNRTVHGDGRNIALGVAVSAVMLCIELLACLEKEAP